MELDHEFGRTSRLSSGFSALLYRKQQLDGLLLCWFVGLWLCWIVGLLADLLVVGLALLACCFLGLLVC